MIRNAHSLRLARLLQLAGGMAIFAFMAIFDGLRILDAYSASAAGPISVGALAFMLTLGVTVMTALIWEKMSIPARRATVCLVTAWFLFMLWTFVTTHKMRGMRLFYEAVGEPDSLWSIAVITYQACVWVIAFAALPLGAWMCWRASPKA